MTPAVEPSTYRAHSERRSAGATTRPGPPREEPSLVARVDLALPKYPEQHLQGCPYLGVLCRRVETGEEPVRRVSVEAP
jgi:hypothetical protein